MNTCVILVNYRGADDTAFCLASLRASSVPVFTVVVDTTPYDPALQIVLAQYPEVVLLEAGANIGFGGGNNYGIRWALQHTACNFFFLLNNDASVLPGSISELEAGMEQHPKAAIMTPRIAFRSDPSRLWYGGGDVDWRRASVFTPGFDGPVDAPEALRQRWVTFATGCALYFRRSTLLRLGGFDPRFFMYEEDVELCLRAAKLGMPILYLPATVILHLAQGSSRDQTGQRADFWSTKNARLPFYAFHIIRNRMLNVYTHANAQQKLLVALFFPLYLLRRIVPFALGGRFDAIWSMLRGLVASWKDRHQSTKMNFIPAVDRET